MDLLKVCGADEDARKVSVTYAQVKGRYHRLWWSLRILRQSARYWQISRLNWGCWCEAERYSGHRVPPRTVH